MIKRFPRVIIIGSLAHKGIGHRKPTKAGIIQETQCMRCDLRYQHLHHGRPSLPVRRYSSHLRHHVFTTTASSSTILVQFTNNTTSSVQKRRLFTVLVTLPTGTNTIASLLKQSHSTTV